MNVVVTEGRKIKRKKNILLVKLGYVPILQSEKLEERTSIMLFLFPHFFVLFNFSVEVGKFIH